MRLAAAEKVDDFVILVVEHFDLGWFFAEKHPRASGESLHVCGVLRKQRNDFGGETILAADVWNGSNHENSSFLLLIESGCCKAGSGIGGKQSLGLDIQTQGERIESAHLCLFEAG